MVLALAIDLLLPLVHVGGQSVRRGRLLLPLLTKCITGRRPSSPTTTTTTSHSSKAGEFRRAESHGLWDEGSHLWLHYSGRCDWSFTRQLSLSCGHDNSTRKSVWR